MFPLKCIWPTKWIAFILPRSCKVNHESLRTFQITVWLMTRLSQNSLAMANLQLQGWEGVNLQLRQRGLCQQGPLRVTQRQQHPREGRPPPPGVCLCFPLTHSGHPLPSCCWRSFRCLQSSWGKEDCRCLPPMLSTDAFHRLLLLPTLTGHLCPPDTVAEVNHTHATGRNLLWLSGRGAGPALRSHRCCRRAEE